MARNLRTNYKIGDILSPEDLNRANAQTNSNTSDMAEVKSSIVATAENAAAATQAAVDTAGYMSALSDAIAELPDGQAVSAEVAQHTTELAALDTSTTLGVDSLGNNIKPSDVLESKASDGFINVVTDEEGHLVEAMMSDGTKVFGGNIEAPNIQQQREDFDQLSSDFDAAVEQQQVIDEGSTLGEVDGVAVRPADVSEVAYAQEIIHHVVDDEGHMLFWINKEGEIQWSKGVPDPVQQHVEETADGLKEIHGDYTTNDNYVQTVCDADGKLLYGVKTNGEFDWAAGVPEHLKDYISKNGGGDGGVILPSTASKAIQNVPNILDKGIIGVYVRMAGFTYSDKPLLGYKWMFDNWDVSNVNIPIDINLFQKVAEPQDDYDYDFSGANPTDKLKKINTLIMYCNEHNIEVTVSINSYFTYTDTVKGSVNGTVIETKQDDSKVYMTWALYCKLIDYMLKYDGVNDQKIYKDGNIYNGDATTYKCKINGIKFFDELEDKLTIHDAQNWLDMLDDLNKYIYEDSTYKRSDISMFSPSSGTYRADIYHDVIGNADSKNSRKFSDLFKCYSIDPWGAQDIDYTCTNILKAYALAKPYDSCNKDFRTVNGFPPTSYGETEQGERTIDAIIRFVALGSYAYSYFSPEYDQNEYYILEGDWSGAGHLYCTRASGEGHIVRGDAYDDIVIGVGGTCWHSKAKLNNKAVAKVKDNLAAILKANGLSLSGSSGLHITSVTLDGSSIWSGDQDVSVTPLVFASSAFSSMTDSSEIEITTDAPYQTLPQSGITLTEVEPRYAANCLKYLCNLLHKDCTRPTIKEYAEYYIASWYNENKKPVYLLFKKFDADAPSISIEIEGNYYITNLIGEVQSSIDVSNITLAHPIYIINSNNIKIS